MEIVKRFKTPDGFHVRALLHQIGSPTAMSIEDSPSFGFTGCWRIPGVFLTWFSHGEAEKSYPKKNAHSGCVLSKSCCL